VESCHSHCYSSQSYSTYVFGELSAALVALAVSVELSASDLAVVINKTPCAQHGSTFIKLPVS